LAEYDRCKEETLDRFTLPAIDNAALVECKRLVAVSNQLSFFNYSAVKQTNGKVSEYKLKENLVEGMNYTLIPEKAFQLLWNRFGFELEERDVISRPVVVGSVLQKDPFVEVYPLKLKAGFAELFRLINSLYRSPSSIEETKSRLWK
jgi:hypothetical protein